MSATTGAPPASATTRATVSQYAESGSCWSAEDGVERGPARPGPPERVECGPGRRRVREGHGRGVALGEVRLDERRVVGVVLDEEDPERVRRLADDVAVDDVGLAGLSFDGSVPLGRRGGGAGASRGGGG